MKYYYQHKTFFGLLVLSLPGRAITETSKLTIYLIFPLDVMFHSIIFINLCQFLILASSYFDIKDVMPHEISNLLFIFRRKEGKFSH